mgnify:CR=1 FL=1
MFRALIILTSLATLSSQLFANQDSGTISSFYVHNNGSVAVKLSNGFPNSVFSEQCVGSNGYAGNTNPAPGIISTLLAAKASGKSVTLSISGCDADGSWLKINAVYLNN